MAMLHATCVVVDGAGVLLTGPSGSGKSNLALRLIDAGAHLVGDDYVSVSAQGGRLWARPAEALVGLLEVRGIGLVTVPHRPEAAIDLVADLEPGQLMDRLPEPETQDIDGIAVKLLRLDPFQAGAAAKLRIALRIATGDLALRA